MAGRSVRRWCRGPRWWTRRPGRPRQRPQHRSGLRPPGCPGPLPRHRPGSRRGRPAWGPRPGRRPCPCPR
ncbi:hypothetical protein E2F92_10610 [Micrococcus aloeverae]|nr:hypothetical protein E2F92_10610 [Micrococcus aloeverae]